MIKQESIKKLKEVVDMIEVIQQYLPNLKRSGKNYFALCPFHSEKTPSFSIAPDKGLIHCFGCEYNADIFKFVSDMEHINYYEAVEKIAKQVNFTLEYISPQQQQELKEKYEETRVLTEIITAVAEVYHRILLSADIALAARQYLISRGVKIDTIEKFKIGFAPADNYICENYKLLPELKDKNCDLSTLYKAGIINFKTDQYGNKNYDQPYDCFKNRIVFPIYNLTGKVVGFGGRILPGSIELDDKFIQPPVYLNTTETTIFNKGSNLYGLYQAKEFITQQKTVCIVEGYMDVVLLFQEGIKTVVAPLGTALTEQQVRLLKRFPLQKIYLLFDPDDAGVEATIAASKTIFSLGEYPLVVQLDENKDPDEYVLEHGVEKLESLFDTAVSVVKYVVNYYTKQQRLLTTYEKLPLLKKFIELIVNITHPLTKSEIIKEISQELKIDETVVRSEQMRVIKKQQVFSLENMLNSKPYSCEEELLWICIHYPEVTKEITEDIFSHDEKYLQIFKKIKQHYVNNNDIVELISKLDPPVKDIVIRLIFEEKKINTSLEEKIKLLHSEIYRVKIKKRYTELKHIVEEMLEGKVGYNPELVNEFKQTLEILKLGNRGGN
ncbi:MAG: DNA primase [Endomicrobia bacterium]|nr:DNA primase [Endomicrobiia bacterium]MCX7716736.1 DNA primase [Endomicrobiia bacterium]